MKGKDKSLTFLISIISMLSSYVSINTRWVHRQGFIIKDETSIRNMKHRNIESKTVSKNR